MRILVDRLWPRGVTKESVQIDRWMKEIAPSHELRKWFGHEPARWEQFQRRYREELRDPIAAAALEDLRMAASKGVITLIFGASDLQMNNAEVLRRILLTGKNARRR